MEDFEFIKSNIRAILLSLGKCATEREFRNAYLEIEGQSFDNVLRKYKMNSLTFFKQMPDVVKVHYDQINKMVLLTRVSSDAPSSFMDGLTVNKYSKRYKGLKLKLGTNNSVRVVQQPRPFYPIFQHNAAPLRVAYNSLPSQRNIQAVKPMHRYTTTKLSQNAVPFNVGSRNILQPQMQNKVLPTFYHNPSSFANAQLNPYKYNLQVQSPTFTTNFPTKQSGTSFFPSSSKQIYQINKNPMQSNNPFDSLATQKPCSSLVNNLSHIEPAQNQKATIFPKKQNFEPIQWETCSSASSTSISIKSEPKKIDNSSSTNTQKPLEDVTKGLQNLSIKPSESTESVSTTKSKRVSPVELKNRLSSMRVFHEAITKIKCDEKTLISEDKELTFSWQTINYKFGEKTFFNIKIFDVVSPDRFTFQFEFEKLDEMMEKLNDRYNLLGDQLSKYKVNDVKIGMMVAIRRAEDKNRWYRAEIIETNFEKLAIRYIDYYTVTKSHHHVKNSDVYYLEKEFANESPKSAFGRLHGIKSKTNFWCISSSVEMMNSRNEIMPATIKKFTNGFFSLSIIINSEDFSRMSDYMVQQDYATYDFEDFSHLSSNNQRSLV